MAITISSKSETLNLRVSPELKRVLKRVADGERRSMANMVEMLVFTYCKQHGIEVSEGVVKPPSSIPHAPRRK